MNALGFIFAGLVISGCTVSSTHQKIDEVSFDAFKNACGWENDDGNDCLNLSGKTLLMEGELYYPNLSQTAEIFPLGTKVPLHEDDELWDDSPDDTVTLRIAENENAKANELRKLHGKTISFRATINTDCLAASLEATAEMERTGDITMLTGFCHYHHVYVQDHELMSR